MANSNNGLFVWHEHLTKDTKAAIAFYSDVVGWKTQPFAEGNDYTMWAGSQGPMGGVMTLPEAAAKMGAPPHWMGHVMVENVDATAERAVKLGGKLYNPPTDIPTVGRFAVIADPQGASLSVFTPMGGTMEVHDPSKAGEFCWNELVTSDADGGFKFYSELFGWKSIQEMDMGDKGIYRLYGIGEKRLGGMMNIPKGMGMPPAWVYYVETSELDAAVARATKRGAKVMLPPMDVPTGGRIAQLMDPQGAHFALHENKK